MFIFAEGGDMLDPKRHDGGGRERCRDVVEDVSERDRERGRGRDMLVYVIMIKAETWWRT